MNQSACVSVTAVLLGCCLSGSVNAEDEVLSVPAFESRTQEVAADAVLLQRTPLIVDLEGRLWKTGTGLWSLPAGTLRDVAGEFGAWAGEIAVCPGTVAEPAAAVPAFVSRDAYFWVDATDADETHFVANASGAGVATWYDCRESNLAQPTYLRAVANDHFTSDAPTRVTTNGFSTMWFGGLGSGLRYNWVKPNGNVNNTQVCHCFAVHGVLESWGNLFGTTNAGSAASLVMHPANSKAASLTGPYFWNCEWNEALNARVYVDDEKIDPPVTPVKTGFQLMEVQFPRQNRGTMSAFYSDRNQVSSGLAQAGGDYLCEVICFTNLLSEADRLAVRTYLKRKWFPDRARAPRVCVGKDTTVVYDTTDAAYAARDAKVHFVGSGKAVKRGAGDYTANYRADREAGTPRSFVGELDIQAGSVRMGESMPLTLAAGDRVSSETDKTWGPVVSRTRDAAADALVKDGDDEALVRGVPEGVRQVEVREGVLKIMPKMVSAGDPSGLGDGPVDVEVPNGDFEEDDEAFAGGGKNLNPSSSFHGWTVADGTGSAFVYDYDLWTSSTPGFADGAKITDWGLKDIRPWNGSRAMLFRFLNTKPYTVVTIPSAGVYELSLRYSNRGNYPCGCLFDVSLADITTGEPVVNFGRVRPMMKFDGRRGFLPYSFRASVTQPGQYRLQFALCASATTPCAVVDDIRLRRIAGPKALAWPLPNGDFEQAEVAYEQSDGYGVNPIDPATTIPTLAGWTFDSPQGWTLNRPAASVVFPNTKGHWTDDGSYNDTRYPGNGLAEGFFFSSGSMKTSFVPPAGTHYLLADLGYYGEKKGTLEAFVTVGDGAAISLGRFTPAVKHMTAFAFPTPFTADGSQSVALELVFTSADTSGLTEKASKSGLWVDDLRLADSLPVDTSERVVNGGGESSTGWTGLLGSLSTNVGSNYSQNRKYSESYAAFGSDAVDGERFLSLGLGGGLYQSIYLPIGTYRLSLYAHSRCEVRMAVRDTLLFARLSRNGVTNELLRAQTVSTNFVERIAEFRIAEAGDYELELRDEDGVSGSNTIIDGVSLRMVEEDLSFEPPFAETTELNVAQGARLHLGFEGTNHIQKLRLGGRVVSGVVSAKTHPEFLSGPGCLESPRRGMVILFR